MKIAEIFYGIQGEGKTLGVPSVFVRLYGCNLRCQFNGVECDTPYAVDKESDKALNLTYIEAADKIIETYKGPNEGKLNVIFTGGEPMMFQDYMINIIETLKRGPYDMTAEVETNGTLPVKKELSDLVNQFNVSLKLSSSNQKNDYYNSKRINYNNLGTYPKDKSYFKFVVNNIKKDLKEIESITDIVKWSVYLMPEGLSREVVLNNSKKIMNVCLEKGYTFSPREHINVFGDERGV